MDVGAVSEAVALMAATGVVSGVAEHAALGVVARLRERLREVFGGDARSVDALERALEAPQDAGQVRELASALAWYAERDEVFASELEGWATEYTPQGSLVQNIRAGRDSYTAGRDMTVQRPAE